MTFQRSAFQNNAFQVTAEENLAVSIKGSIEQASKLVGERITITFDFKDEMVEGEVLTLPILGVEVFNGIDPNPKNLIYSKAYATLITDSSVSQKIHKGLPGVIYRITCKVTGSFGHTYEKQVILAVIPNAFTGAPDVYSYFTSQPYPIEVLEGYGTTSAYVSSKVLTWGTEGYSSSASLISAIIFDQQLTYTNWPPEGYNHTPSYISAIVHTVQRAYNDWPPEGYNHTPAYVSAIVFTQMILTYMNPEGYSHTSAFISGTVT